MNVAGPPWNHPSDRHWLLLSRHGLVLFYLAMNPNSTMRDMSLKLGLTERTLYTLIKDLASSDMIRVKRVGRSNTYAVNPDARFIHPLFSHLRLETLLDALKPPGGVYPD